MENPDLLFGDYDLGLILENKLKIAFAETDTYRADYLLNVNTYDLVEHLYGKYAAAYLELQTDDIELCAHGATLPPDSDGGPLFTGANDYYVFAIPFSGDQNLFFCRASTFTTRPPRGRVADGELHLRFSGRYDDLNVLRAELRKSVGILQEHLAWVRRDLDQYNSNLKFKLLGRLNERKEKLLQEKGLSASLGIPVRQRRETPVPPEPPLQRAGTPPPLAGSEAFAPEPELSPAVYEQILATGRDIVPALSRSPRALAALREEDLRTHFLLVLNSRYEGETADGTFDCEGSADIFLRVGGKNAFAAQCRFWQGPETLRAAIDQLLACPFWRDAKAAILLGNRRCEDDITGRIPAVLENHPNFRRHIPLDRPAEFRAVLQSSEDPNREMVVTILTFNIPDGTDGR